jgi:hypothetical protein
MHCVTGPRWAHPPLDQQFFASSLVEAWHFDATIAPTKRPSSIMGAMGHAPNAWLPHQYIAMHAMRTLRTTGDPAAAEGEI